MVTSLMRKYLSHEIIQVNLKPFPFLLFSENDVYWFLHLSERQTKIEDSYEHCDRNRSG